MLENLLKEIAELLEQCNKGLITDAEALRAIVAMTTTNDVLAQLDKED